jgi:hypothetical protein
MTNRLPTFAFYYYYYFAAGYARGSNRHVIRLG